MKSNSYDISIDISPWTSCGYSLKELKLVEKIGGELSSGEAEFFIEDLTSNNVLSLLTDLNTGSITLRNDKEGGIQYEDIPFFITSRDWIENHLKIEFICIPDHLFYDEFITTSFEDINAALGMLYPGKANIESTSDINNGIPILQVYESNYNLCTRLCLSFKHDTIFGYGWDGLFIKDIPGEPKYSVMSGLGNMSIISPYSLKYSYILNTEPKDMEMDTENSKSMLINYEGKEHYIMGTDYYHLVENYVWNKRFYDVGFNSSIKLKGTDMLSYRLGDVVEIGNTKDDQKLPFTKFLVASNELYYSLPENKDRDESGLKFSWTSEFFGLDKGKWNENEE